MVMHIELPGTDDFTRALNHARRSFASLEQSVEWLLPTVPRAQLAGDGTSRNLADRLASAARASASGGPLVEFAERFSQLVGEHERLGHARQDKRSAADIEALAARFESAGCDALALMTASQATRTGSAPASSGPTIDNPPVLAEWGRVGRTSLDANARAFKMPANKLELYVVRDFLPLDLCQKVIDRIDADLVPSGILAMDADTSFRTSRSCNFRRDDPIVRQVDSMVADLVGIPVAYSELMQGQRYDVGQEFKPHHDYFHKGEYYYEQVDREGGQRSWTAMIFLNTPEAGGCTDFPQAGVRITPRAGNIVVWNNMDELGYPNPFALHHGMPVEAGSKWVITKWFRERQWGLPA